MNFDLHIYGFIDYLYDVETSDAFSTKELVELTCLGLIKIIEPEHSIELYKYKKPITVKLSFKGLW